MTTKLNDLQMILLSHAAMTDAGNMFPLPASVTDRERTDKELKALLRRGPVIEAETTDRATRDPRQAMQHGIGDQWQGKCIPRPPVRPPSERTGLRLPPNNSVRISVRIFA